MGIGKYAKLIFKQMYNIQEKPKARLIRERKSGSPINPGTTEIILDIIIPVLYSETQVIASDAGMIVPKTQMFFYIRKDDLPENTKPVVADKIVYKDRTYYINNISEIANTIYKVSVDYA